MIRARIAKKSDAIKQQAVQRGGDVHALLMQQACQHFAECQRMKATGLATREYISGRKLKGIC